MYTRISNLKYNLRLLYTKKNTLFTHGITNVLIGSLNLFVPPSQYFFWLNTLFYLKKRLGVDMRSYNRKYFL